MSSSSTSLAPSTDHSFYSTLKWSAGSSTLITARIMAVPGRQDPGTGALTINLTVQETLSWTPWRDLDALFKRKSPDTLARKVAKNRRVYPPHDALPGTSLRCYLGSPTSLSLRHVVPRYSRSSHTILVVEHPC